MKERIINAIKKLFTSKKERAEDERKRQQALAEMEHARRVMRGRVCHAKIMARIQNHPELIKARNKRIQKQKKLAALCGYVWPTVRHVGIVIDQSYYDAGGGVEKIPDPYTGFVFIEK